VIAVDTSALMAVLLEEPGSDACRALLEAESEIVISAGTAAEALVVGGRRGVGDQIAALIDGLAFIVAPVTAAGARRVAKAYQRWGKGLHPAGLNFGDCFAYAVAEEYGCPLLFVGRDFGETDVQPALGNG
jgi:ribonuclease VapC